MLRARPAREPGRVGGEEREGMIAVRPCSPPGGSRRGRRGSRRGSWPGGTTARCPGGARISSRKCASSSVHQASSRAASTYSAPPRGGLAGEPVEGPGRDRHLYLGASLLEVADGAEPRDEEPGEVPEEAQRRRTAGWTTSTAPRWKSPAGGPTAKAAAMASAGPGRAAGRRGCREGGAGPRGRPRARAVARSRRRAPRPPPWPPPCRRQGRTCGSTALPCRRHGGRGVSIPREEVVARRAGASIAFRAGVAVRSQTDQYPFGSCQTRREGLVQRTTRVERGAGTFVARVGNLVDSGISQGGRSSCSDDDRDDGRSPNRHFTRASRR